MSRPRKNSLLVPLMYDQIFDFHEDRARLQKERFFGFIDRTGRLIIPIMFLI